MKLSGEAIEEIRALILSCEGVPEEVKNRAATSIVREMVDVIPPYGMPELIMPIMLINALTHELVKAGSINLLLDKESGYWNYVPPKNTEKRGEL